MKINKTQICITLLVILLPNFVALKVEKKLYI